jgi:hypothetical protein
MAEKIQNNLSNDQKKSSDEQFLQAPRNWQKCSALVCCHFVTLAPRPLHCRYFQRTMPRLMEKKYHLNYTFPYTHLDKMSHLPTVQKFGEMLNHFHSVKIHAISLKSSRFPPPPMP